MKHSTEQNIIKLFCLGIFIFMVSSTYSQKIVIVSAADYIKTIKKDDLFKVYHGDLFKLDGKDISFLDHERNSQVYYDFIKQYFNMTADEMAQFWVDKKLESGKKPPKFLPESFLPKALISITGSISYYYDGELPPGTHKVDVVE